MEKEKGKVGKTGREKEKYVFEVKGRIKYTGERGEGGKGGKENWEEGKGRSRKKEYIEIYDV